MQLRYGSEKMAALLRSLPLLFLVHIVIGQIQDEGWWEDMVMYQIYPRSFKDSNGDGVGDLKGITSKLEHFVDAGVGAMWLSPIYPSPMVDFGYDISDFKDVDPIFGTMADFEELIAKSKALGIKVVLDFVPNHSSDKHPWFEKSIKKEDPYTDYYIWNDGEVDELGTRSPPNNWISVFSGPAWTWNEIRGQWYFHQFAKEQPDLNYYNAEVWSEMRAVVKFWLEKGIDGFRVDAVPHLVEIRELTDEPRANRTDQLATDYAYLDHPYTKDQPLTYEIIQDWRNVMDNYAKTTKTSEKIMMTEAYTYLEETMKYYDCGSQVPFNFKFIIDIESDSTAKDFENAIRSWLDNMPSYGVANWVMGNHDRSRLASRFPNRSDQMTMLAMILPGIAVTYYGEEIGMIDTWVSWEDTQDPQACNLDPDRYAARSRDPNRSPFQWDSTANAGFSTNFSTWLPVNSNYQDLNLAEQKVTEGSHYKIYQALIKLRKEPALQSGSWNVYVIGSSQSVLVISRQSPAADGVNEVVLLINFDDAASQELNLASGQLTNRSKLKVYTSSVGSKVAEGTEFDATRVILPSKVSLVLVPSSAMAASLSYLTFITALVTVLNRYLS